MASAHAYRRWRQRIFLSRAAANMRLSRAPSRKDTINKRFTAAWHLLGHRASLSWRAAGGLVVTVWSADEYEHGGIV